ncbi:ATP-binding cassette domain-containing protein [Mesorhizobium sp. VK23B]|uniref:ATP-binding cassette domain-containing protein n=1 Tax=Mesorhizobium dulcispinae TaxID=3072316 RepID=A0ABU4XGH8_9HYPH|nr:MULTISPECIES: ATP-binding cassette domain-containing protein [unclassified Mesorhizobium]MDX8465123.1 ATP-binding cassette domain-containing protein [Mesorhizobium sp. VK23B]MDX8472659.1 ATP-binding cassette domain-containing protein [Mesorhizobium sp. VK23A]
MNAALQSASRRSWRLATGFAFAALFCGILLGGVSAWLLGSVAIAGLSAAALTFNFHMPAAFIRLFAIGRTAARYGERLAGHKAALTDQVTHRAELFAAMAAAPAVRRAGWQLGDDARLADYLDDVEDLDYARLRAGLPALTLAAGLAVLTAASAILAPLSLLPIILFLLAILFAGNRVAKAGAMAWERARSLHRRGASRLGAAMASAVPLKAEGAWSHECADALAALSRADGELLALRCLQARLDMIGAAFGPVAGIGVMAAAWHAGRQGPDLLLPMLLAFSWLALGEAVNGGSRMLVAVLRGNAARTEIGQWTEIAATVRRGCARDEVEPPLLRHGALQRRAPDGRAIGTTISVLLARGQPTVLVGASGSGKTSLLKQIAGWIGDDAFAAGDRILSATDRRAQAALVLHDAVILEDIVRANLFAGNVPDAVLWRALEAVEMDERIREAGGLDAWIRQDRFSLGEVQRINLARAWLSTKPLMLLDEPTEHLDDGQGQRILERLMGHLSDRIIVISSHRASSLRGRTIELQP